MLGSLQVVSLLAWRNLWRNHRRTLVMLLAIAIGALVGMEIPLIARLLENAGAKHRFENVLTVDYLGALAASLLFPLVIVPMVGLMTASLLFGALNLVTVLDDLRHFVF